MGYNCVVLIKQVPDTKRITGEVMNDDGTVNRSALPAIFNPEDLNALELALQIKDQFGGHITVITMGLPAASAILREALFRGADEAILITDRRCAASDTLATSYILSRAVKKLDYDIVLCGRQAIDGDTAQVGPQLAEKLGITQITYVEELTELRGQDHHGPAEHRQRLAAGQGQPAGPADRHRRCERATSRRRQENDEVQKRHRPIEVEQKIKAENPGADEAELKSWLGTRCSQLEQQGPADRSSGTWTPSRPT